MAPVIMITFVFHTKADLFRYNSNHDNMVPNYAFILSDHIWSLRIVSFLSVSRYQ